MAEIQWEVVYETNGMLLAEILRGLLEAQEISVVLSQEGVGRVYGLTVGTLGRVQVLVPASDLERAQHILEEYENGEMADQPLPDAGPADQDDLVDGENPIDGENT
jgi:hypothetical protein